MKKLIVILLTILVLLSIYTLFYRPKGEFVSKNSQNINLKEGKPVAVTETSATKPNEEVLNNDEEQKKENLKKERIKNIQESFSNTKTGQRVVRMLELIRYLDSPNTDKGKEAWDNMQKLKEDPIETFNEIKQGTPNLSVENETRRQFLIQFASNLDVSKDDKLVFLDREFKNSVRYSTESDNIQANLTPSIILETYIRISGNNEFAEKLLTDMLPEAPVHVQKTLLSSYNKINPKKTDELIKQYGFKTN
ncbi:MAG: hypothetical protein WCQ47_06075 [bacterium]